MYKKLGAHVCEQDGVKGVSFAVWALNAKRVSVVGNFNNWDGRTCVMRKYPTCGVWTFYSRLPAEGEVYKYEIKTQENSYFGQVGSGRLLMPKRPQNASIVYDLNHYHWNDEEWMSRPDRQQPSLTDRCRSMKFMLVRGAGKGDGGSEYPGYRENGRYAGSIPTWALRMSHLAAG